MGDHETRRLDLEPSWPERGDTLKDTDFDIMPDPDIPDQDQLERGRKLFAGACDFVISAAAYKQLPNSPLVDVAFAGRSNVGKSSLINALTGRKTLARTSNTPGRTQQINFFNLGQQLHLVDLPGYGYARAPKKDVDQWNRLIRDYLRGRAQLKRVMILIDSRHGLKDTDHEVFDLLNKAAVNYQIVLTKIDKIKKADQEDVLARTREALKKQPAAHPGVLLTSSEKKIGIDDLRGRLAGLATPPA